MESDARYTWVGLSMAVLTLLLAASIYWLSGAGSRPPAQRYTVLFRTQSLDGVQTGTEVRMRGVKVGRVVDYGIPPGNSSVVRLIIEVDKRVPVTQATSAVVNRNLLTGLAQISLVDLEANAPPLTYVPPGEIYPIIAEGTPEISRYADLIQALGTTGQQALQRVNILLSDRNQKVIAQTLESTHLLTGRLAEAVPDLRATLQETRQAAASLENFGRGAETAIEHAERQIDAVSERSLQTLDTARSALDTARTTLIQAQDQIGSLGMQLRLSADLAGQEVHTTADAMRQAARDVQRPARALADPERILFGPSEAALGPGEK